MNFFQFLIIKTPDECMLTMLRRAGGRGHTSAPQSRRRRWIRSEGRRSGPPASSRQTGASRPAAGRGPACYRPPARCLGAHAPGSPSTSGTGSPRSHTFISEGLQGYVVYLGWPIAPLVYECKCGGMEGVAGSQPMSTAVHRSPNKLKRSNSIFNLCLI